MNWLYIISGLISLGLLIYLFIVLLKPETFE
jgi:K+-transporting ATPase KdpF subunit